MITSATILIVDDQLANVRLLERILERAGYTHVRSTTDPRAALALVHDLEPDLVLLDLHMPHVDGFSLLEQLAGHRAEQRFLPVLVLTADTDDAARRRALGLGANDFITKPFDADEVLIRCRNLLETRVLYRELASRHEAVASDLLTTEHELRDSQGARRMIVGALERMPGGAGLQESAAAVVAELSRSPGVDAVAVITFDPAGDAALLAIAGVSEFDSIVERPLPVATTAYLRERAATGPWATDISDVPIGNEPLEEKIRQSGLRTASYIPIGDGSGTLHGLLVVASRLELEEEEQAERLAEFNELASVARVMLALGLARRWDERSGRHVIDEVIRHRAFSPVFQPIVDLRDTGTIGFEALTRFADGARPDLRFAEAQRHGLGLALEEATLQMALGAARDLPPSAWLSVNTSPEFILSEGRLAALLAHVERLIVVEITEHVAIPDYECLRSALRSIGGRVRVAIDDAGAGFASFRHVVELQPDFVKLDADLVRGIGADPGRQALAVGMRYFAQQTGTTLIAEGVETEQERAMLSALQVNFAQGYLFGRPAPALAART